jgi:hypothetical protein
MNWVSFSLYGDSPKYIEGAIRNATQVRGAYPGFVALFFVDQDISDGVVHRLEEEGARVARFRAASSVENMMQRVFAFDAPEAGVVLFRDADSRITAREVAAVSEWSNSPYGVHSMRDFPYQFDPLGGGMWGIKKSSFPNLCLRKLWEGYVVDTPGWAALNDQVFLHRVVWPIVRRDTLFHDGVGGAAETRPFPVGFDPEQGFVGEVYEVREGEDAPILEHRRVREAYMGRA